MPVEHLRDTQMRAPAGHPAQRRRQRAVLPAPLDDAGVAPDDLTCHDDVAALPFTTKADLRDHYPFGMFAVPRERLVRVHASSGTTGNPTTVGYTAGDIDLWADLIARTLAAGGMKPGDMLQNAYGYGLFTGGLGLHYGCERLGATILPISGGNTDRQLKLMRDFGVTALSCTPSYALYLAEAARDRGLRPSDLPIRVGYHGAEPWTNEMRRQIEDGLGIDALDIYGLSEMGGPGVAFECRCKARHARERRPLSGRDRRPGDPRAGPRGHGRRARGHHPEPGGPAAGALPHARPLQPRAETCECGRTLARMSKPVGRTDDMLIIRGVNVFPSQIEEVLMTIPQIEPHYQILVDRKDHLDMVEVWIEVGEDVFGETMGQLENFERAVQHRLYSVLNIRCR